MAASNVTIDDSSPLIQYDPADAWAHRTGADAKPYMNGTYSSSVVEGATAKFSFTGTGFWVYGAKRADYGQYLLLLDDEPQTYANAGAPQDEFAQVLYGMSGLADTQHTVVFFAAGGGKVDLDSIMYESTDGQQGQQQNSGASTGTASAPAGTQTAVGRVSANPNAVGGPNSPSSKQGASAASSAGAASSANGASTASGAASSNATGQPSAQPNAQPNGQADGQQASAAQSDAQATGQNGAQPTAQPNGAQQPGAQPNASPSDAASSSPSSTSTTDALAPSISGNQAEQANSPQVAGTSKASKGLPTGAIVGIALGALVGVLLIVALLLICMRRRRQAAARRRMTRGLPSPILPLQDPEQAGYFFGGYGSTGKGASLREKYLGAKLFPHAPGRPLSQESFSSGGAATNGRGTPYPESEKDVTDGTLIGAPAPAVLRDSVHTNGDTATLVNEEGYDVTDMYSKMRPARPPRPPQDFRLST